MYYLDFLRKARQSLETFPHPSYMSSSMQALLCHIHLLFVIKTLFSDIREKVVVIFNHKA